MMFQHLKILLKLSHVRLKLFSNFLLFGGLRDGFLCPELEFSPQLFCFPDVLSQCVDLGQRIFQFLFFVADLTGQFLLLLAKFGQPKNSFVSTIRFKKVFVKLKKAYTEFFK